LLARFRPLLVRLWLKSVSEVHISSKGLARISYGHSILGIAAA